MPELVLPGLRPEPLALYLAALGVLRLVAEQKDAQARGFWRDDVFVLDSTLDAEGLVGFLANEYAPTPVVAPWNGGSGFYPNDKLGIKAIGVIMASADLRFAAYQRTISEVREIHNGNVEKADNIARIRAELPDDALRWIDAALVLTNAGVSYPPLLGTGGNDGRLDFSANFMLRLGNLLSRKGGPESGLIRGLLFGEPTPGLLAGASIGQFFPSQVGGANSTVGFGGSSPINPWSYVLMIEGALVPSSATTRRLESSRGGTLVFPFTVRSAMAGYASASAEASRDEMWLPLWSAPAPLAEVRQLFAEGRAKVGTPRGVQREAVDGLDFARAIASLGVSRGIDNFARFGFQQRNGLSFFAVPLGRWKVHHSRSVDLLAKVDPWLTRLRRVAGGDRAPASLVSATRRLENAIMEMCRREDPAVTLEVLVALGEIESILSRSKERVLDPIEALSRKWLSAEFHESAELRLAMSLASAGIRRRLAPVHWRTHQTWAWADPGDKTATWRDSADLVTNLIALVRRRDIEDQQQVGRVRERDAMACGILAPEARPKPPAGLPRRPAALVDLARFIDGQLDEPRIETLTRGLSLIDWQHVRFERASEPDFVIPSTSYALMLLARDLVLPANPDEPLPSTPGMVANAATGHVRVATGSAIRRLRGVGYVFAATEVDDDGERARRSVAALAFPVARASLDQLTRLLFPRHQEESKD